MYIYSDKHDVHRLKLQLHKLGTVYMYILGIPNWYPNALHVHVYLYNTVLILTYSKNQLIQWSPAEVYEIK